MPSLKGAPSGHMKFIAMHFNASFVEMAWEPPHDALSESVLSYAVKVVNIDGAVVFNITVTKPKCTTIIPDLCEKYEVTVTAMCGIMKSNASSSTILGGKANSMQYNST